MGVLLEAGGFSTYEAARFVGYAALVEFLESALNVRSCGTTRDGDGCLFDRDVRVWQIVLQKSFWGNERNFVGPLMRFVYGDGRVLVVSYENHHGPSHRRCRACGGGTAFRAAFARFLSSFDFRLLQQYRHL
jgi:hypothetical protein